MHFSIQAFIRTLAAGGFDTIAALCSSTQECTQEITALSGVPISSLFIHEVCFYPINSLLIVAVKYVTHSGNEKAKTENLNYPPHYSIIEVSK